MHRDCRRAATWPGRTAAPRTAGVGGNAGSVEHGGDVVGRGGADAVGRLRCGAHRGPQAHRRQAGVRLPAAGERVWGERRLPRLRFFPADATIDRWLQSSPLTVRVAATAGSSATDVVVRIVARQLANGKVEFALRKILADGSWSGTLLPRARMFPTTATLGSWLSSTPISVLTTQPSTSSTSSTSRPVRFTALDAGVSIRARCGARTPSRAGGRTNMVSRTCRGGRTGRCPPATRTRAPFAAMAPLPAGAGTAAAKPSRRAVGSLR